MWDINLTGLVRTPNGRVSWLLRVSIMIGILWWRTWFKPLTGKYYSWLWEMASKSSMLSRRYLEKKEISEFGKKLPSLQTDGMHCVTTGRRANCNSGTSQATVRWSCRKNYPMLKHWQSALITYSGWLDIKTDQ